MALIRKHVVVCNRCKYETEMAYYPERGNLTIEDDSFYLCGNCLSLIKSIVNGEDYISTKSINKEEDPLIYYKHEPVDIEFEEIDLDAPEYRSFGFDSSKFKDINFVDEADTDDDTDNDWNVNGDKREYIKWDDYIVEKIVKLRREGCSWTDICKQLKLTKSQMSSFLNNVKHPDRILNNEKYIRWANIYKNELIDGPLVRQNGRSKLTDGFKAEVAKAINSGMKDEDIKNTYHISASSLVRIKNEFSTKKVYKKSNDRFTPELVKEMFEAHKGGMSWNQVAKCLDIPVSTITRFVNSLATAKEGDWMYEYAKEYGYIN